VGDPVTRDSLHGLLTAAMKARDPRRVSTLRLLISAVKYREIEIGKPLDAVEMQAVIHSSIKKRRESIELFEKGGRAEMAQAEREEMTILQEFLPPQLGEGDVAAIVDEAIRETGASGVKDLGKVMKAVMPKVAGRADGRVVGDLVKARLS
jgi:uncharacterized protein YqeY